MEGIHASVYLSRGVGGGLREGMHALGNATLTGNRHVSVLNPLPLFYYTSFYFKFYKTNVNKAKYKIACGVLFMHSVNLDQDPIHSKIKRNLKTVCGNNPCLQERFLDINKIHFKKSALSLSLFRNSVP